MPSHPCEKTERRVEDFLGKRTGNRKKESEEMREAVRHAIGSEWSPEIKCRPCWDYIRNEVANVGIGCRAGYASYVIGKNVLFAAFSKEILRFYRNPSPPHL